VGHLVQCGVSGMRNVEAQFLMLGWERYIYDKKARQDMLRQTGVFASDGICGSRIAFECFRGTKRQRTLFYAQVSPSGFRKKYVGIRYIKLVFLHPVGSVSHIV
jgi:hypothetical protein